MDLPFGELKGNRLIMSFSSADYSVAGIIGAIKERCDMLGVMEVNFMGACTDIPAGPSPVFRPVNINAYFDYVGNGDAEDILGKVYVLIWEAVALTFPTEAVWAIAKGDFSRFIIAQADLLRARSESNKS
jgi:hypothetical protein